MILFFKSSENLVATNHLLLIWPGLLKCNLLLFLFLYVPDIEYNTFLTNFFQNKPPGVVFVKVLSLWSLGYRHE